MTPIAIHQYTPDVYDKLPSLEDAARVFEEADGINLVRGPLQEIFTKHSVLDRFGVHLLHAHFDMEKTDKLVSFRNVSLPINVTSLDEAVKSRILPSSWACTEKGLVPYEFTYATNINSDVSTLSRKDMTFIEAFYEVVKSRNLLGIIGLGLIELAVIGIESTHGNADVTLPFAVDPGSDTDIEAFWTYTREGRALCKIRCMSEPHAKKHVTVGKC